MLCGFSPATMAAHLPHHQRRRRTAVDAEPAGRLGRCAPHAGSLCAGSWLIPQMRHVVGMVARVVRQAQIGGAGEAETEAKIFPEPGHWVFPPLQSPDLAPGLACYVPHLVARPVRQSLDHVRHVAMVGDSPHPPDGPSREAQHNGRSVVTGIRHARSLRPGAGSLATSSCKNWWTSVNPSGERRAHATNARRSVLVHSKWVATRLSVTDKFCGHPTAGAGIGSGGLASGCPAP